MFNGTKLKFVHAALFLGSVTVISPTNPVLAMDVAGAKAANYVCEGPDGFLRVNAGAPGEAGALVNNINNQRNAAYAQIGAKNGVSVADVGKITGAKLIKSAPQFACK